MKNLLFLSLGRNEVMKNFLFLPFLENKVLEESDKGKEEIPHFIRSDKRII